jgi:hypothetical protein
VCERERERDSEREIARERERERETESFIFVLSFFSKILPQSGEICKGVHYGVLFGGCTYACVRQKGRTYSTSRNQRQLTESQARFFFYSAHMASALDRL